MRSKRGRAPVYNNPIQQLAVNIPGGMPAPGNYYLDEEIKPSLQNHAVECNLHQQHLGLWDNSMNYQPSRTSSFETF